MTSTETHVKINGQQVAGIDIPVSRVRACLDSEGLNKVYDQIYDLVEDFKSQERPLSELDADSTAVLNQCIKLKIDAIAAMTVDRDANQKSWDALNEYAKAFMALKSAKVRISFYAVVVLATAVDTLVHDLGLHAVEKTIADKKINITTQHLIKGIENTTYYPLFSQLPSFYSVFNSGNTDETADVAETDVAEPTEEDIAEVDDGDVTERKRPRHMNNFMHYISLIVSQHVPTRPEGRKAYRVTSNFKKALNLIVKDFISNRMASYLQTFLEIKDTKTVNEFQVIAALKLMLKDTYMTTDSTKLFERINRSVERVKNYNVTYKECKDPKIRSEMNPETFIARKDDVVIPQLPVEIPKENTTSKAKKSKAQPTPQVEVVVAPTSVPESPVSKSKKKAK